LDGITWTRFSALRREPVGGQLDLPACGDQVTIVAVTESEHSRRDNAARLSAYRRLGAAAHICWRMSWGTQIGLFGVAGPGAPMKITSRLTARLRARSVP
jgi:hypothetical protein